MTVSFLSHGVFPFSVLNGQFPISLEVIIILNYQF